MTVGACVRASRSSPFQKVSSQSEVCGSGKDKFFEVLGIRTIFCAKGPAPLIEKRSLA